MPSPSKNPTLFAQLGRRLITPMLRVVLVAA
jgi:hypothetical protein